jgi:hypothetical protein
MVDGIPEQCQNHSRQNSPSRTVTMLHDSRWKTSRPAHRRTIPQDDRLFGIKHEDRFSHLYIISDR